MGWRSVFVAAIAVATTIALGACGDSSTSSEPAETTATEASNSEAKARSRERAGQSRIRASILGFGKEGSAAERAAAAASVRAFYAARIAEDWHTACPYLTAEMRGRVKQIGGRGDAGCGKGIEAMTATASVSGGEETVAQVKGLRKSGNQGFLIYTSGRETENAMLIKFEKGKWRLSGLNPTPIP